MHMFLIVLAAATVVVEPEGRTPPRTPPATVKLARCLVALIEEAQVPGREAGALTQLDVREGQRVTKGQQIAQIDDARPAAAQKVANFQLKAAQEKASNDINIRYSRAAYELSWWERVMAENANRKTANTFSEGEVRRLKLAERKSELSIEQASLELRVAITEAGVRSAEVEAATEDVQRRKIFSPLDGVVVKVNRHVGEWLQPGDALAQVVRMDQLRIEGLIDATDVVDGQGRVVAEAASPRELDGRPVTVVVALERGRRETFQGKVVFVSPVVQAGGQYRIWAEVPNRLEGNHWLLRPGLLAEMTIPLK
jgi:multidrug efflux pump subunit AcrA (membrane-fusion protein)